MKTLYCPKLVHLARSIHSYLGKGFAFCVLLPLILSQHSMMAETVTYLDEADGIESLITTGEAQQALDLLNKTIRDIDREEGRFSEHLIRPLVLKGDAQVELGQLDEAIETYGEARTLRRQHFGLHDLDQIGILYREASVYYDQERYLEANDRHEYAYSIYRRKYGAESEYILPGLFTLADWYMQTNNILTARGLYEKALDFEKELELNDTQTKIRALEGLAMSYRLEKFQPSNFKTKNHRFTPRPYGSIRHPEHYYAELNDFAKGEEALLELVRIHITNEQPQSLTLAEAKLKLADWYLLFEKQMKAMVIYKDIWNTLEGTPQFSFVEHHMIKPKILYKPVPSDPEKPDNLGYPVEMEGRIELSLTVTAKGKTKKVVKVASVPGMMLERSTKLGAHNAIYRPAFSNGEPTETEAVKFVHTFPYYIDNRGGSIRSANHEASLK